MSTYHNLCSPVHNILNLNQNINNKIHQYFGCKMYFVGNIHKRPPAPLCRWSALQAGSTLSILDLLSLWKMFQRVIGDAKVCLYNLNDPPHCNFYLILAGGDKSITTFTQPLTTNIPICEIPHNVSHFQTMKFSVGFIQNNSLVLSKKLRILLHSAPCTFRRHSHQPSRARHQLI